MAARSASPGFAVVFPGKKKKKRKSVKRDKTKQISASYVHPSKRIVHTTPQSSINTIPKMREGQKVEYSVNGTVWNLGTVVSLNPIKVKGEGNWIAKEYPHIRPLNSEAKTTEVRKTDTAVIITEPLVRDSTSKSEQRIIRRPQATRPPLNQTFESNETEINFPDGKEPKRLPKRRSSSPENVPVRSFLNIDRYRDDFRSVSRSMVRDQDDQYSASSSAIHDEKRGSYSNSSRNPEPPQQTEPSTDPPPEEPIQHRRDPSLIFGPNPSVTRDFQDEIEELVEEEESDDNYSSILKEMGRLETKSAERGFDERESESEEEKEDEVNQKKNPMLIGELRLALAGRKKGGTKSKKKKKKKKRKSKKEKEKEVDEDVSHGDAPDLFHDLNNETSNQPEELSLEERFRLTALQLDEPDESEDEQSLGPVFLEDDPPTQSPHDGVDLSIEKKFKELQAMSSEGSIEEPARSQSQVQDLESEIELLRTQLQLSKEKLRDTMTKSVNRTEKLMLQISKVRNENESLKKENRELRQKAVVAEHQNLTNTENLHENQLDQLEELMEENARLREKHSLDAQDLQLRLGEVKRQLNQALSDILESKRANSSLQGELEHYMKRGKELTKQLTHVKAELETSRSSQIRFKQEFDETIQETSGDVRQMRDRIATLEAQTKVQADEKTRLLDEMQALRAKVDEANSKLVDQTFKSSSRTTELNKKLSQKEQRIKELSSKPQGFNEEISSWQARCRKLVEQNESMQDDLIEANAKVEGLGNRVAMLQDEILSLKTEIREGKDREKRLQEKVQRSEETALALGGELQRATDTLHRQERQAKDHTEKALKLSKRIEDLQAENDEVSSKRKKIVEELRAQVQKLKEDLQKKSEEHRDVEERFESRLNTLKSEINALSAENDSLQRELLDDSNSKRQEELQNQLNEMREQIAAVNSQLVDQTYKHSQRISDLNKRVAEKEQTIQNLRDELQKKETFISN